MNRRRFLKTGAAAAAVCATGMPAIVAAAEPARQPDPVPQSPARPTNLSVLDAFNYAVGTQTFGASYGFTAKPRLLETAEAIRKMGSSIIKFRLGDNQKGEAGVIGGATLRDVAAQHPVMRELFNLSFGHYLLWVYPLGAGRKPAARDSARDQQIYDLTCFLLKTYSGTGKTFYLGHWEGDWEIRSRAGSQSDPTPERIAAKIRWLNRRQQAVDDAKRDTSHNAVDAFCYAEVNRVRDCMQGRPGMANEVIPHTRIDFVSYSSYDTANRKDIEIEVPGALDYIESKLPPKPGIRGKRVWIGEYGYPAQRFSPQEQAARSRRLMRTALQWGCPFILYWEMYNNEVDKDGRQRGFWLIDDRGVKQPAHYLHYRFLQWARGEVADFARTAKRLPTFDEYRKRAVEFLDAYRA